MNCDHFEGHGLVWFGLVQKSQPLTRPPPDYSGLVGEQVVSMQSMHRLRGCPCVYFNLNFSKQLFERNKYFQTRIPFQCLWSRRSVIGDNWSFNLANKFS